MANPLLAPERHQKILRLVEDRGSIRTIDLATELDVTDETIRRDLQLLAENGQVNRIHGGATSVSGRPSLRSLSERRALNVERKQAIAREAIKFVEPGETIVFDSSSTVFELVSLLPDLPFRVVTNSHTVVHQLTEAPHIELISTGGRYERKTQTFVGFESQAALDRHNINKAFISCIGLDLQRGASEGFEQQALFKEHMVGLADQVFLLIDSTKLDTRSEYFFARHEDISHIITDEDADAAFVEQLRGMGIEVITASLESPNNSI